VCSLNSEQKDGVLVNEHDPIVEVSETGLCHCNLAKFAQASKQAPMNGKIYAPTNADQKAPQ
jgi:hypothetical protein